MNIRNAIRRHLRWGFPAEETARASSALAGTVAGYASRLRAQTPAPSSVPWRAAPVALVALLVGYVVGAAWLLGIVAAGGTAAVNALAALVLFCGWAGWWVRRRQLATLEAAQAAGEGRHG